MSNYPANRKSKHGMARRGKTVPEYWVWAHMIQRCENPNDAEYKNYGARGITVCQSWHDFQAFYADLGSRPSPKHTIERINNNLGYSLANCKWATQSEQNHNHRRNRWIEWKGERKLISVWSAQLFGNPRVISRRLSKGWPVEDALSIPLSSDKTGWEARRLRAAAPLPI